MNVERELIEAAEMLAGSDHQIEMGQRTFGKDTKREIKKHVPTAATFKKVGNDYIVKNKDGDTVATWHVPANHSKKGLLVIRDPKIFGTDKSGLIKANDEWIDSDGEYREFVEDVVPKYHGRYRSGETEFKSLNVVVRFSGNETKFWFDVGDKVWGRVWSAEDADRVLATLQKAHNMMD